MTIEYVRSDDFEERCTDHIVIPETLPIQFSAIGQPIPGFRAAAYTIDAWIGEEGTPRYATLAVAPPGEKFALFMPQSADDLRALAAAALRCAATLDGGRGVQ